MLTSARSSLVLATLIAWTSSTAAEDNVLGLPKPRDARRPGAIMLHGGGRITSDAWDRFYALAGGRKARIVIVPSAGYRRSDYASDEEFTAALRRRFGSWLRMVTDGEAASVDFLATDDPKDADDAAFVRPLAKATAVWFCGGDQARLEARYVGTFPRLTKFQTALREVLERGGVVGGSSAGMAALPQIMTRTQERLNASGPLSAVAVHGFGLFTGAIVEQHFDTRNGRLERFTGLLRDSARLDKLAGHDGAGAKMLGLAVDEGTTLFLYGDRLEAFGRGNVQVFLKAPGRSTIIWHTLKPGDRAGLKQDRRGEVTLAP
jgi:cyanophycinase